MNGNKALTIAVFLSYLSRIVAFVCITVAAIHFQKTSLLWWYILPALLGCSVETKEKGGADNER